MEHLTYRVFLKGREDAIRSGSRQSYPDGAEALACAVAEDTRYAHPEGATTTTLTVYVWPHRGDAEHYRAPMPDDAQQFVYRPHDATD